MLNAVTALGAPGDIYNLGAFDDHVSFGLAINNSGQVGGYSTKLVEANHPQTAIRYTGLPGAGGAMSDLGTLGGATSHGYGINDAGQVAGYSDTQGGGPRAFVYTGTPGAGGAMVDLLTLGGQFSQAFDVNNSGQLAGNSSLNSDVQTHAFRYTGTPGVDGVMEDLLSLGGNNSFGIAINDAGHVVGDSFLSDNVTVHAFLAIGNPDTDGAIHDLGTLGGTKSNATAINNAGHITGSSDTTGDATVRGFRYTGTPGAGGAMTPLGTLGGPGSYGNGINDAGVIVGVADRASLDTRPALWQLGGDLTPIDLDAWLDLTNPVLGGKWTLEFAYAINDSGMITGVGTFDDGPGGLTDGRRAYLLDASSMVPEPTSLSLMIMGSVALLRRRTFRSR